MIEKKAETSVPINDLIAKRWSARAFDPDRPVSEDQITALCEAARWACSCFNDQPWRFIIWDKNRDADAWNIAFDCLTPGNKEWVKNVPVLMAAVAGSKFSHNDKPNRWGQYDTGAASISICLQATSMGLMAHQMGGFDRDRLREEFGIPDEYTPMAMIAIGYQADAGVLDRTKHYESEFENRERNPLEHSFFVNTWGVGITDA